MARYKEHDYSQGKFIPIHLEKQRGKMYNMRHIMVLKKTVGNKYHYRAHNRPCPYRMICNA
jgi:hypothetical protein